MLFNAFPAASRAAWRLAPVRVAIGTGTRDRAHGLQNVPKPLWNLDFAAFEHQNARTASLYAHPHAQNVDSRDPVVHVCTAVSTVTKPQPHFFNRSVSARWLARARPGRGKHRAGKAAHGSIPFQCFFNVLHCFLNILNAFQCFPMFFIVFSKVF